MSGIDCILITNAARQKLLLQSIESLIENAAKPERVHLVLVSDGLKIGWCDPDVRIATRTPQGASACRNIGAGSIPKYRRQQYVMFCDDDCYFVRAWDQKLLELAELLPRAILSGHNHPFNNCVARVSSFGLKWDEPLVISTVSMFLPWDIFDDAGPFDEPGGSGGSEDYALCQRALKKGHGFAVTSPQVVLHTGLTSSSGIPIVGADLVRKNNAELEEVHGIKGKVLYQ